MPQLFPNWWKADSAAGLPRRSVGSLAYPSITFTSAAIGCIAMTMVLDWVGVCAVAGCDQAARTPAQDGTRAP